MASIASMGIGSGLDIQSLIQNLVAAERAPMDQRLTARETTLSVQLSALGTLKGAMSQFQSAMSSLKDISTFNRRTATSGDTDLFTASATSSAVAGTYEVEVTSVAQAHKIASSAFAEATQVIGSGSLTFQFGDPTKPAQTVDIDAAHTSLEGIRDAVNAANIGVRASIVNGDAGYQLVFAAQNSGLDNALKVTVADDDGNNTNTSGLSQLAYDTALPVGSGQNMTEAAAALDAQIFIDGIQVTSSSNTFAEVIDGISLTVKKAAVGTKTELTVGLDNASATSAVESFVSAYNEVIGTIDSISGYDAETKEAGPLIGDAGVRGIAMQLRQSLSHVIEGGTYRSLVDIGISTNRDGTLELDSSDLSSALSDDYDGVGRLFAAFGLPSDTQINFVSATSDTEVDEYAVNITQLATQGTYTGGAAATTVVGATNDTFSIKIDGVSSGTITLSQGTYTGAQLASELQSRINGDSTLQASDSSVTVEYDGSGFIITSDRYGSASTVEIVSADTTFAADFGLALGAGTTGVDVAGTIGGVDALGTGQTLTSPTGLALEITGGAVGDRGTVQFSRGVADEIDSLLTGLLSSTGLLASKTESLNDRIADITDQREAHDRRIEAVEKRYIAQFTAMDMLISQLNATSSYLDQQLASLASLNVSEDN